MNDDEAKERLAMVSSIIGKRKRMSARIRAP